MATYKWRVPIVQAVQFNGKNHEEVKELIGDTSEGEEFLVGTGTYENPEPVAEPKSEAPKSEAPKSEKPGHEVGKHEVGKSKEHEAGKHEVGKPAAKPEQTEASEAVPPTGVPYDPKAKPAEGPKEVKESLAVAEGDWVVKQTHNGKIEVNPEGFPDGYEFVSS